MNAATATVDAIEFEMVEQPTSQPLAVQQKGGQLAEVAPSGPMADAIAFMRAGGTMEQMKDMLALQREWKADMAKQAYTEAMAEFKKNPPTILKDKRVHFDAKNGGTATDYWHATLGNVANAIIEGLAVVGVSHSWKPERKGDRIHVTCTLTHKMGHSESIELDGPLDNSGNKNSIQQMSSTTTYLSRYTLLLITGLAVKDEILPDDDGNGAASEAVKRRELWNSRAATALTAKDLQEVRKDGIKVFTDLKDRDGYKGFFKAVKDRATQLEQPHA